MYGWKMLLQRLSMFEAMQSDAKLFEVVRMLRSRFKIHFVKFRDVCRGLWMMQKVVHVFSRAWRAKWTYQPPPYWNPDCPSQPIVVMSWSRDRVRNVNNVEFHVIAWTCPLVLFIYTHVSTPQTSRWDPRLHEVDAWASYRRRCRLQSLGKGVLWTSGKWWLRLYNRAYDTFE